MATPREAGPSTPGKAWWRFRVLLVGLVLCRGLVLLCVMPPFEGWDEYQHVGYVVHVGETGRRAVLNETVVPPALVTAAVQFPQPKSALEQIGRLGAVDYATFWARRDPPVRKEGDVALYQAQHAPFYYRMAAPLFRALGGVADLRTLGRRPAAGEPPAHRGGGRGRARGGRPGRPAPSRRGPDRARHRLAAAAVDQRGAGRERCARRAAGGRRGLVGPAARWTPAPRRERGARAGRPAWRSWPRR